MAVYTDPNFDITVLHPVTKDISRLIDSAAINNAIRNLILTKDGSIPFARDKGTIIKDLIGELYTPILVSQIQDQVEYCINKYEPRVILASVDVIGSYDSNEIKIKIEYVIKQSNTAGGFTMAIALNR
jgi:phage baseplate assembly protein W